MGIERNNIALERINNSVSNLTDKKLTYERNKEAIENLEKLLSDKEGYETKSLQFKKLSMLSGVRLLIFIRKWALLSNNYKILRNNIQSTLTFKRVLCLRFVHEMHAF